MNSPDPAGPQRVPTLTEVVAWPRPEIAPPTAPDAPAATTPLPGTDWGSGEADLVNTSMPPLRLAEEKMVDALLAEVQHQVDLMLEYRLREVLTPLLARAADNIVRDARTELASTLRDVVARAVAQELSRHRNR